MHTPFNKVSTNLPTVIHVIAIPDFITRLFQEFIELRADNFTVGHGFRARKCAFWKSYLPGLLGKRASILLITILFQSKINLTFRYLNTLNLIPAHEPVKECDCIPQDGEESSGLTNVCETN